MAAPVGQFTIKFNSIKFDSLGLLVNLHPTQPIILISLNYWNFAPAFEC